MLLSLGFLRVSWVEYMSTLCQGQASLLRMHYLMHVEKWTKDTRLNLGLIGAWRGPVGVGDVVFEVYEVSQ